MTENETPVKPEESLSPDQIEHVNAIIQALQNEVNKLTSEKIQVQASLTVIAAKLKEYQDRENEGTGLSTGTQKDNSDGPEHRPMRDKPKVLVKD